MLIHARTPRSKRGMGKCKSKSRKTKPFVERKAPVQQRYRASGTEHIKSHIDEYLTQKEPKLEVPVKYEGDLAAREAAAQVEIARKAQCVAPAFNKGPYTYVATEEQALWVGRK